MQSRHRVFAEDLLLAQLQGDDHFDNVPDSLVLIIFNKLADARSLGRCAAVSRRFNSLVPLVDDACLRIDRVISSDAADAADDALGVSGTGAQRQRTGAGAVFSGLLKTVLSAVLKPFGHCDAGARSGHGHGKHAPHHSPAQVLKNFSSIRNLRMELPVSDVGTDDGVLLKWKADFGSTLGSCVILGASSVSSKPPPQPTSSPTAMDREPEELASIPESLHTNGGLKLRVVWTISSLIAASARHYLLQPIITDHETLDSLNLTDADGQGVLTMDKRQLQELRARPLSVSGNSHRTLMPSLIMRLWYAPHIELPGGVLLKGATLVAIRPSDDVLKEGGGVEAAGPAGAPWISDAFEEPYRTAAKALFKRRTYSLEMNSF